MRATLLIVPDSSASIVLALARFAELMPPGNMLALSWTLPGAAELKPQVIVGTVPS